MTRQRHYHPLAALRFLRKAVVVCLLPLANALLEFSLNALLTALRQDAALLLFLCGASSILLEASSWALDEAGVLRLRWAFISKRERIIRGEAPSSGRSSFGCSGPAGWCSTRWASLPGELSPFICTKKTRRSLLTA